MRLTGTGVEVSPYKPLRVRSLFLILSSEGQTGPSWCLILSDGFFNVSL
jgi:hypothetical protein